MKIILIIIRIIFIPIKIIHRIVYGPSAKNITGYAWYSEAEYKKIIEASEDDLGSLVGSYKKWLEYAEKNIDTIKKMGWIVVKVNITNDNLKIWLKRNQLPNTSENREKYVKEKLQLFLEDAKI